MRKYTAISLLFLAVELIAAPLPRALPILTEEDLTNAAASVPVVRIDYFLPEIERAAEASLSGRFFNQPEEHRFSGVTSADWRRKWNVFSNALVDKAKRVGLDSISLRQCLDALNQGRNRQTMLWPGKEQKLFLPDTPATKIEEFEKKAEEKYQQALREREKNPEQWYNNDLAIIPVAAYLGRHKNGECWIIVCKWEYFPEGQPNPLGHIMVWAMDIKSRAVVGYVTCD